MSERPPPRGSLWLAVVLLLAFCIQAAYGSELTLFGARPSISLTALLTACLFTTCETGAWLGFMAGLLEASYASRYIGSFIVTRTLAGYLVGLLEERIFRDNILIAAATVFVGTLFVETCFFLFAPQPYPLRWFTSALLESVCNMGLALPLFALFRRLAPKAVH